MPTPYGSGNAWLWKKCQPLARSYAHKSRLIIVTPLASSMRSWTHTTHLPTSKPSLGLLTNVSTMSNYYIKTKDYVITAQGIFPIKQKKKKWHQNNSHLCRYLTGLYSSTHRSSMTQSSCPYSLTSMTETTNSQPKKLNAGTSTQSKDSHVLPKDHYYDRQKTLV